MVFWNVGELWKVAQVSMRQKSEGVSRNNVKRRFLWMVGRARSWLEEGIGSPRWAMTLVFIDQRKKSNWFTLPTIERETVSGVQDPVQALEAFTGRINLAVQIRTSFPIHHFSMNPLSTTNQGSRLRMAR